MTYALTGTDAALFTLDTDTGELTFTTAPDFESPADNGTNNVYDVIVTVSDGSKTDVQSLAITVTNENDNDPVITNNGSAATNTATFAENGTGNVIDWNATDADGATENGGGLTYALTSGVCTS